MDKLQETVSEHAVQLGVLAGNMTDIKDTLKENSKSLARMAEAMVAQERLFEKLANIEEEHRESKKRIHSLVEKNDTRITESFQKIEEIEKVVDTTCPIVDLNVASLAKRVDSLESIKNYVAKIVGTAILLALLGLIIVKG